MGSNNNCQGRASVRAYLLSALRSRSRGKVPIGGTYVVNRSAVDNSRLSITYVAG